MFTEATFFCDVSYHNYLSFCNFGACCAQSARITLRANFFKSLGVGDDEDNQALTLAIAYTVVFSEGHQMAKNAGGFTLIFLGPQLAEPKNPRSLCCQKTIPFTKMRLPECRISPESSSQI